MCSQWLSGLSKQYFTFYSHILHIIYRPISQYLSIFFLAFAVLLFLIIMSGSHTLTTYFEIKNNKTLISVYD